MRTMFIAADGVKLLEGMRSGKVKSAKDAQALLSDIDPALVAKAFASEETKASLAGKKPVVAKPALSDDDLEELTAPPGSKSKKDEKPPEKKDEKK